MFGFYRFAKVGRELEAIQPTNTIAPENMRRAFIERVSGESGPGSRSIQSTISAYRAIQGIFRNMKTVTGL